MKEELKKNMDIYIYILILLYLILIWRFLEQEINSHFECLCILWKKSNFIVFNLSVSMRQFWDLTININLRIFKYWAKSKDICKLQNWLPFYNYYLCFINIKVADFLQDSVVWKDTYNYKLPPSTYIFQLLCYILHVMT